MIKKLADRHIDTAFGTFTEILFYDGQSESIALVRGDLSGAENVLCRIHSACIGSHVFNSVECTCRQEMAAAQAAIAEAGRGVIIYLDQEGKGNGHFALVKSTPFKKAGHSQGDAYEMAGFERDSRSFRPAAAILKDLGVVSVVLMTGNAGKAEELSGLGIEVSDTLPINVEDDHFR